MFFQHLRYHVKIQNDELHEVCGHLIVNIEPRQKKKSCFMACTLQHAAFLSKRNVELDKKLILTIQFEYSHSLFDHCTHYMKSMRYQLSSVTFTFEVLDLRIGSYKVCEV